MHDTIPQPAPQAAAPADLMGEIAGLRALVDAALVRDQEPVSTASDLAANIPQQAPAFDDVRVETARQLLAELPAADDNERPYFWIGRLRFALEQLLDVAAPAPAGLSAGQREVLAAALADAAGYREGRASDAYCADCKTHPADLCDDHAADLDRHDAYVHLAAELGIGLDR